MPLTIIPPKGKEIVIAKESERLMVHGRDLLMFMYQELDILDCKEYFGLVYCDTKDGKLTWLGEDDSVKRLEQSMGRKITFQVAASCHPENPEEMFDNAPGRKLFCDLMKEKLLKGELGCDVETHAKLDAFLIQAALGDYNCNTEHHSYENTLLALDVYSPVYASCGSNLKDSCYLKRVKYYHKRNSGIGREDGEKMYLGTIKQLPFYPFKLYHTIETSGIEASIGLRERGLCVIQNGKGEKFLQPQIISEYLWSDVRYCTHTKRKLRVGVFSQTNMDEVVLKVKGPKCLKEAERFFKDVTKYRDMYLAKKAEQIGKAERAALLMLGATKNGPSRKISAFTESIENSFRILRQRTKADSFCEPLY